MLDYTCTCTIYRIHLTCTSKATIDISQLCRSVIWFKLQLLQIDYIMYLYIECTLPYLVQVKPLLTYPNCVGMYPGSNYNFYKSTILCTCMYNVPYLVQVKPLLIYPNRGKVYSSSNYNFYKSTVLCTCT